MGSKLWQRISAVPLSTLAKVRKAPNPFFSSREKGLGDKGKSDDSDQEIKGMGQSDRINSGD